MPPEENRKTPAPENVEPQSGSTVSARTANQQNTTTHTNSRRPARRKVGSRFLPCSKGCLFPYILGEEAGRKDYDDLNDLYRSLADRFNPGDVINGILVELFMADYWRTSRGLRHEMRCMPYDGYLASGLNSMAQYTNAARRNLDRSLKMLIEKESADAEYLENEDEEAETAASVDSVQSEQQANAATESWGDGADIHTLLPAPADNNEHASEEQPSTTTPTPSADQQVGEQTGAMAAPLAANAAETTVGTTETDLPKAA
jgi:hypothetical protein